MRFTQQIAAAILLSSALAACSQQNAPSDKIKEAATSVIGPVDGRGKPVKLAEGKYAPADECKDTPGAEDFRNQLQQAIAAKDVDRLSSLAAPDVKLDFGDGSGTALLQSRLNKHEPDLWGELADIMKLGCGINDQGGITIPWYAAKPIDGVDPAMAMLVTGEKVPMRRDADAKSPEIEDISWDIVTLADGLEPDDAFQRVKTSDGTEGFVATGALRSLLDYRLTASSRDGKWSFTSLVSGD